MKINFKNIAAIAIVMISIHANAQFYVGIQTGIANIQNNSEASKSSNKIGGALKLGYVYGFNKHFGVGAGIEYTQYKQDIRLKYGSNTLDNLEVDASGSAFIYNLTTSNYKESQTLQALQIPLFLQYKSNINKGVDFNFRAGVKYLLPLSYKFDATASSVKGVGYYPDFHLTIDNMPEYGFGIQNDYNASGKYETKGVLMSTFELGFTFQMGAKNALYTAIFMDTAYGSLLNIEKDESYIGHNPKSISDRKANGLYSIDKDAKIQPVSFGLSLGLNF